MTFFKALARPITIKHSIILISSIAFWQHSLPLALSTSKLIVYLRLSACLNTSYIVSHWVKACLRWVNFNDGSQLELTSLEFLFPVEALWLTIFKDEWFRINALLKEVNILIRRNIHAINIVVRAGEVHIPGLVMETSHFVFINVISAFDFNYYIDINQKSERLDDSAHEVEKFTK